MTAQFFIYYRHILNGKEYWGPRYDPGEKHKAATRSYVQAGHIKMNYCTEELTRPWMTNDGTLLDLHAAQCLEFL